MKLKKKKGQCVIVIYVFECTESVLIFFFFTFLQKSLKGKKSWLLYVIRSGTIFCKFHAEIIQYYGDSRSICNFFPHPILSVAWGDFTLPLERARQEIQG